jgi:hypothetical protein
LATLSGIAAFTDKEEFPPLLMALEGVVKSEATKIMKSTEPVIKNTFFISMELKGS